MPHRSTVTVLPTVNCLVELIEMPFTVIPLDKIEVVNLERVGFNLKNFDAAIVFKVSVRARCSSRSAFVWAAPHGIPHTLRPPGNCSHETGGSFSK